MRLPVKSSGIRDLVKRYGADPTGVRDSSQALQNAIDDEQRGGDTIFIPPGLYLLNNEVAANLTGSSLHVKGAGPATKILIEMDSYKDAISINSTPSGCRILFEDLSFIGKIVVDPLNPDTSPQCGRALVLAGTLGSPTMRRITFAGMYVKGAIAYMGNGAVGALVDECDWIGCTVIGDSGLDVQSLLECNIIFGATVRNSRFTALGAFGDQQFNGGSCRQSIRFRHFDVAEGGTINSSQAQVSGCTFYNMGPPVSTLEPTGTPNGPTSPIYPAFINRAYGFVIPPGVGLWDRPTGTATGGYPLQYTFQIRIDTPGARGVATWSTRFQNTGFGGGFTDWVSQGATTSAIVNGMTFSMSVGTPDFVDGQVYQCYVLGTTGRMRQVSINKCIATTTFGIVLSEVDRVSIDQLDFDNNSPITAIDLYDCDTVKITQPQIRGHKILAEQAGFGFNANQYVYVEDANSDAVVDLTHATKSFISQKAQNYPQPTITSDVVVDGYITIDGTILNTVHQVALSASATLSITNPVVGETYQFEITNAGSFTITWPGTFRWPGGTALVPTSGGVDVVVATYNGSAFNAVASQAFA